MARKRMISPNIWEDPSFNKLSIGARLLFIGIISHADDEGYIRGDPGSLKRLIFGFDDHFNADWVQEVQKMKNIHFFDSEGETYAHLLKWHEHQKQQKDRIQESAYPMCSKCVASDKQVPTEVKLSKDKIREDLDEPSASEDETRIEETDEEGNPLKVRGKKKR